MSTQLDLILTSEQVAGLLHCSVRTVEDRARAGDLPGVKYGESWVFPTQALLEAVNEQARTNTRRRAEKPKAVAAGRRKPPQLSPA